MNKQKELMKDSIIEYKGVMKLEIPKRNISVMLPFCQKNAGIMIDVLSNLHDCKRHTEDDAEDNNGIEKHLVSSMVIGFIKSHGNDKDVFTKNTLLKRLGADVDVGLVDSVLSDLIVKKAVNQWNNNGYECFRINKKFFELYGDKQ